MSGGEEAVETNARPAMTTLRLSMSASTGRFWRALEALHAGSDDEGSFVAFLVRSVMRSWVGMEAAPVAYGDVYVRDRWRCASPVCRSRNVTPHHVKLKSHGGGEERGNLVALCERCHLELASADRARPGSELRA